jgi:adenylate cyclase
MDRFFSVASRVVFQHDGAVEKFVGDEIVAQFYRMLTGDRHAEQAIRAAQALLRATGHDQTDGPWLPVGAGVHTGRAWFGAVGEGPGTELTALGDAVNVTARLASVAGAGEVLITSAAASAAGFGTGLERRMLELKGKSELTEVVSVRIAPAR